ncbi:type III-A CRISPR-associated RAMP protein Csm5 (plasmid) [Deinococcus sp. VB343]
MTQSQRRRLKFRISIRPMSPVHIGIGNEFLARGAYHLYPDKDRPTHLALVAPRPLASRLLDQFGEQANFAATIQKRMQADDYPDAIARDIENGKLALRRMSVHPGARPHLKDEGRNGGLKVITALPNGLPYIPGSSVKGALRTAWLDWQVAQAGAYDRFVKGVKQADLRRAKSADDNLLKRKQLAEGFMGVSSKSQPNEQNRDLFRAVQVSDLMPDRTENLTRVYAVLAMSYQSGDNGFARPANNGSAGAQAWECLNPDAGATYTGTVTVDLDLLDAMATQDPDAQNLKAALAKADVWQDALAGYGSRVYGTERQHYDEVLADLPNQSREGIQLWGEGGLVLDWVLASQQEDLQEKLFPLGMGTGLLAHSLLGVMAPQEIGGKLGDEEGRGSTLMKDVLDTGIRRDSRAYADPEFPAPKSRRVVGDFPARRVNEMRAERPLGWTELTLTQTK